jgi:hypothetical protein
MKSHYLLSICNIDFPKEKYIEYFGEIPSEYRPENYKLIENGCYW